MVRMNLCTARCCAWQGRHHEALFQGQRAVPGDVRPASSSSLRARASPGLHALQRGAARARAAAVSYGEYLGQRRLHRGRRSRTGRASSCRWRRSSLLRVLVQRGLGRVEGPRRRRRGSTRTRGSDAHARTRHGPCAGAGLRSRSTATRCRSRCSGCSSLSFAHARGGRAAALQRGARAARPAGRRRLLAVPRHGSSSGSSRSRTGRASSCRSACWSCSRSSCARRARRSRSPSTRRTRRPAPESIEARQLRMRSACAW